MKRSRYTSTISARLASLELRVRELEAQKEGRTVETIHRPKIATIQRIVAEEYGIDLAAMWSTDRHAHIALPRQVAIVLAARNSGYPSRVVERCFKKCHATVYHAMQAVDERCETDPKYRAEFEAVKLKVVAALEAAA